MEIVAWYPLKGSPEVAIYEKYFFGLHPTIVSSTLVPSINEIFRLAPIPRFLFDVNFDDDEYIKTTLNNPNWLTGMLHTDDKSDINDLKLIKKSIDPSIKFELNVSDKGDELEKILNKEN